MNKQHSSRGRKVRWSIPVALIALWVAAMAGIRIAEVNFIPYITAAISLFTVLLLALWGVLFTGLSFGKRMILLFALLAVVAAGVFVVKNYTRVEGSYSGSGFPRLVWKWTPSPDARLPELAPIAATNELTETLPPDAAGAEFTEFLGPGRTNVIRGIHLERDWKTYPPVEVWRRPIGLGWSGFVVADGRAITQEQRGDHELVVCYSAAGGDVLWAHTNLVRFSEALGGDGPRATPTIAADRVYAIGATGILDCLDAATGRLVWSTHIMNNDDSDNQTWGKSSSPLVYDKFVVVTGGASGPLLLAYDRETGKLVWDSGRGAPSYASPVLATLAGQKQVLIVNAQSVTGHNAADGAILWDYSWSGAHPKVAQPSPVAPDKVFISAGYGLGAALLELKPGGDDQFTPVEVWRNRNMKAKFANVAIRDGHVYGLDEGILACIELMTGERKWKGGRYGHGQLLLVEDLLLVQSEPGDLALVAAEPDDFRELARVSLFDSKAWNPLALAGNLLFVRNDREAVCLKLATR